MASRDINLQVPEAGDLVQRTWVTFAQKRRWVRLSTRKGKMPPPNPDSIGIVLSVCEEKSTLQVLWNDMGPEEVNAFRVRVVKKGDQQ